jgi:putative ABC transport system substrate-binding protein
MSIGRREFIAALGGAAAWPLVVRAQQPGLPVIGYLALGSPGPNSLYGGPFLQGLAQAGYVPDRNLVIEFRGANFNPSVLPRLAADLVAQKVAVIVTTGSPYAVVAAKAATPTTPIVFMIGDDPLEYALVASINRPGGNVTGVTFLSTELMGKRLNLLLELVPPTTAVGYLCPEGGFVTEAWKNEILEAGRAQGRDITVLEVRCLDFEAAFAAASEHRIGALIVGDYTIFFPPPNRNKILELAARHKIPAMYPTRSYPVNGGLLSYGVNFTEQGRNAGIYTGRILKGEKPADLPVVLPTKFELVFNLKTAKALNLDIPPTLLARADEVIE